MINYFIIYYLLIRKIMLEKKFKNYIEKKKIELKTEQWASVLRLYWTPSKSKLCTGSYRRRKSPPFFQTINLKLYFSFN